MPRVRTYRGRTSTWTAEQITELVRLRDVEKRQWNKISRILGRPIQTCVYQYGKVGDLADRRDLDRVRNIPVDVWNDAQRRNLAERSITAFICGDPAPGQSALDRRPA